MGEKNWGYTAFPQNKGHGEMGEVYITRLPRWGKTEVKIKKGHITN